MSYSKLHRSLVYSSLWTQSDNVRILFITLLSLCDQHGEVQGSRSGLARIANISIPLGSPDPWDVLMGPDKDSSDRLRNPENDGRRIEEMPGGFRILNHGYYRGLRNEDDRREQNRRAQAKFKAKKQVSQGKPSKATQSHEKPPKAHTEADTDTEVLILEGGGSNGSSNGSNGATAPSRPALSKKPTGIDEEWLTELSRDPAYQGLDVSRIHAKMVRWYTERGRQPTRRRLLNWLNKEDAPISKPQSKIKMLN